MKRLLVSILFLIALCSTANAQTIVQRLPWSQDGKVWVENPKNEYQAFSVQFYGSSGYIQTCGGSLAPLAYLVPCDIPSGADWARVSSPAMGYINFTGNRFYGTSLGSAYFSAGAYTGIGIVNPTEYTSLIGISLYDAYGQLESQIYLYLDPYSSVGQFASEWFTSADFGSGKIIEVFAVFYNPAVLLAYCNGGVCYQI